MPTTSLPTARALLFAALDVDAVHSVTGWDGNEVITAVYDYEPIGEMAKPAAITIFATGKSPEFYLFSVRIYHATDVSAEAAQKNVDQIILAVEQAMTTTGVGNIGPSEWTIGFTDGIDAIVAQSDVSIGREDF